MNSGGVSGVGGGVAAGAHLSDVMKMAQTRRHQRKLAAWRGAIEMAAALRHRPGVK
jgi:hypothetical protein